jgi:aminoglycoside phosphotransferase (APT) family kinase protein
MNITDALSGRGGISAVQWALLDPASRDVVAERLDDLLEVDASATAWHLHRAKFKPDRKLNAHFNVTIRREGTDSVRSVVVNWAPDVHTRDGLGSTTEHKADSGASAAFADMEARAIEHGLAAPFRRLRSTVPEWGMEMLVSPLDPTFPQLVELSDEAAVRSMLASALETSVDELPSYTVSTIRYRPGERHVLRYDPSADAPGAGTVFAKMSRGHDVGTEYRVATRASEWVEAMNVGAHAARPLAYVEGSQVLLYSKVEGEPLSQLFMRADEAALDHVRRTGTVLRALHDSGPAPELELKPHDFHKEIKAIARAAEHVDRLLPDAGAVLHDVLQRAEPVYEALPAEPATFVHGDFKADHLLVDADELTVLDFGTCGAGDPALDLGKFAADLHWWYSLTGDSGTSEARAAFFEGYGDAPSERLLRAAVYESLILMKSTVRRVPLFEGIWADRTTKLIRRADELLSPTERSSATPS